MNRSAVTDNRFGFTQPMFVIMPRTIDPAIEQADNNDATKKQQSQQERPRKRVRSIVQFDNVCEIFSPAPAMEDIHSQNETEMVNNHHHHPAEYNGAAVSSSPFWYSPQDYQQFKATALADAKQVTEASPKIKSRIRQAFQVFTATTAATAKHPDSDGNQTLLHPEWEKHVPLHGCCEAVGLEYLVDRNVYRRRKRLRRTMLDAVDQIQKATPLETTGEVQQEQEQHQCLLIRRACEDLSGPSKQFAHYVGIAAAATADTTAMKLDEDLEEGEDDDNASSSSDVSSIAL